MAKQVGLWWMALRASKAAYLLDMLVSACTSSARNHTSWDYLQWLQFVCDVKVRATLNKKGKPLRQVAPVTPWTCNGLSE